MFLRMPLIYQHWFRQRLSVVRHMESLFAPMLTDSWLLHNEPKLHRLPRCICIVYVSFLCIFLSRQYISIHADEYHLYLPVTEAETWTFSFHVSGQIRSTIWSIGFWWKNGPVLLALLRWVNFSPACLCYGLTVLTTKVKVECKVNFHNEPTNQKFYSKSQFSLV